MKQILKNCLLLIGLYLAFLLLTLLVFDVTGLYVWNQRPTPLVLTRILVIPLVLSLIVFFVILFSRRFKKQ